MHCKYYKATCPVKECKIFQGAEFCKIWQEYIKSNMQHNKDLTKYFEPQTPQDK